jgi:hypothetical protein
MSSQPELLRIRPWKFTATHWGWLILYAALALGFLSIAVHRGTIVSDWKLLVGWGLVLPFLGLGLAFVSTTYPIIRLNRERLQFQDFWIKYNIDLSSIARVIKGRGLAAKKLWGPFSMPRPYNRIEVHYIHNGKEKDLEFNLLYVEKYEVEVLLKLLKELRPDLEMPVLNRKGM